jgi:sugar transferase (PEP-CTERM/EpsH1 system associated)
MFAVDAETQLPDDLLLLTDKMSMAVSLECRVPLLDHELVETGGGHAGVDQGARRPAQAPDEGGAGRPAARDILHRKKRGFGTPMGAWLKRELAPVLRELLAAVVVNARPVHPAWSPAADGRPRSQPHRRHRRAAGLMNLEIWSRHLSRPAHPADVADELKPATCMNILYVCHRFPFPPKRGGKIRPFNMIRHLQAAGTGHRVLAGPLASRGRKKARALRRTARLRHGHVSEPAAVARMVVRLPLVTPSSMGYFYSPELAAKVKPAAGSQRWDLIFVHCSSVAQYVEHVQDVPKILDFGDMDSQKWLEYANYKPFPLSLGYRSKATRCWPPRSAWRAVRPVHRDHARRVADAAGLRHRRGTDWFPNGVDAEFFCPTDGSTTPTPSASSAAWITTPTRSACRASAQQVWPLLQAARPAMKLLIVGADPSPEMRALGELPGVTVTGSVPDVRPYIRGSALMVAPLAIARGTQNKILEAMAMGVPVVTSSPAAGGVDAEAEQHLLVADSPRTLPRRAAHRQQPGRAPAPGHGRPRAHAQPPCLAAQHAAAGRHHRALPRGLCARQIPRPSETIA